MLRAVKVRRLAAPARREQRHSLRLGRTVAVAPRPYRRVPKSQGVAAAPTAVAPRPTRQSLTLAVLVFIQYALIASDIRFVATANYLGIAIVNVCIALNTWSL